MARSVSDLRVRPPPQFAPGVITRPATLGDSDEAFAISCAALRPHVERALGWDDAFQRRYHRQWWTPHLTQMIVRDGVSVGVYRVDLDYGGFYIDRIAIAPASQGIGIGRSVIESTQFIAAYAGLSVRLSVLDGNRARVLYDRLGFTVERIEQPRTHMVWRPPG